FARRNTAACCSWRYPARRRWAGASRQRAGSGGGARSSAQRRAAIGRSPASNARTTGSAAEYPHERHAPPGRCHSTEARRAAGRRRPTFGNQASLWTTRTQAVLRRQLFGATDGDVKVFPDTVLDAVDAAMNRQRLPAVPGVLDNGGVADVGDLLDDVELAHAVELGLFARETGDVVAVFVVQVANGAQPAVNQAQLVVTHRCTHAAATVVAGDQNVFDLEDIDGVLDHRQAVEVGVQHH